MFTGIVRHTGVVTNFQVARSGAKLTVGAADLTGHLAHGDSVCVSGVCLTVVEVRESLIQFDVIDETLRRSTLGSYRRGRRVNLETSLRVGDRLDGHFVQGHIDGTATLVRRDHAEGEDRLRFRPDPSLIPYLVPKGSVAVDGVSLTIADVDRDAFTVALIPTTLELTTLAELKATERVNIESDIITRTVVHHVGAALRSALPAGLTVEQLQSHGFA